MLSEERSSLRFVTAAVDAALKAKGSIGEAFTKAMLILRQNARRAGLLTFDSELQSIGIKTLLVPTDSMKFDRSVAEKLGIGFSEKAAAKIEIVGKDKVLSSLKPTIESHVAANNTRAFNAERMSAAAQVEEQIMLEWNSILDSRTCPVCWNLDGALVKQGEAFPGGYSPGWHPHCRCAVHAVKSNLVRYERHQKELHKHMDRELNKVEHSDSTRAHLERMAGSGSHYDYGMTEELFLKGKK